MNSNNLEGLLPCPNPWCEALEREGDYSPVVRLHNFGDYRVVCTSCVLEGPLRHTKAEAITAWNRRPDTTRDVADGEVGELVERASSEMQNLYADRGRLAGEVERLREALVNLIAACDKGRRSIKPGCGIGGMTIEANIRAEQISGVSAWAVEEARNALFDGGENVAS